ncbi:MAG TPA: hypothetical protein DIT64_13310 [Verrucomicrobiales bacterium]|nr:hypothetical protein [Verrucomicrobiales bacterium]HRJ11065.1 biopolymer transporter ExbD [Prosthecobacter sp.]HRK17017.1 biopolymer transporter ExbD [Prosthecobacter sp.]
MKRFSNRHLPRMIAGVSPMPLLDAAAVLLLVFLVLMVLPEKGVSITAAAAQPAETPSHVARLAINRDLEFSLDGAPVAAAELEQALRARVEKQPGLGVVVNLPGNFASRSLSMIMETLRRVGVSRTALEYPDAAPP